MGICNKCDRTVDYCDCIPQKYREQIAKEVEEYGNREGGLPWHNYTVLKEIIQVIKGE